MADNHVQVPSTALDPTKVHETLTLVLKIAASLASITPTTVDDMVVAKISLVVNQPWFPMFLSFLLDLLDKQQPITAETVAQAYARATTV